MHDHRLVDVGLLQQSGRAAKVQNALNVVDVTLEDRQPRVLAASELAQDGVCVVFQVDADDFVSGNHDVIDGDVLQIQDADQHVFVPGRNQCAGLVHHGSEFFTAEMIFRGLGRGNAQQSQDTGGKQIDGPHQWVQKFQQWPKNVAGREGNFFREQGCKGFRSHLGKNQDDDRQQ